MPTKQKPSHKLKTAAEEIGVALAVAAIAGAYFIYGPNGVKHKRKVKSWALKARAEALEKLENLKKVSEPAYHKVVDDVTNRYDKVQSVDKLEITALGQELKSYWKEIKKHKILKKK